MYILASATALTDMTQSAAKMGSSYRLRVEFLNSIGGMEAAQNGFSFGA